MTASAALGARSPTFPSASHFPPRDGTKRLPPPGVAAGTASSPRGWSGGTDLAPLGLGKCEDLGVQLCDEVRGVSIANGGLDDVVEAPDALESGVLFVGLDDHRHDRHRLKAKSDRLEFGRHAL